MAMTYQLLVAVVLSAQATDVGVNKATRALFRDVKTPDQMVALGEEGLKAHIKTIGLFNAKAKNVIACPKFWCAISAARFRRTATCSPALPGVGRKTANVVMNTAFGAETFAVDTHIFRVGNRTGLRQGQDRAGGRTGCSCKEAGVLACPGPALPRRRASLADPARPLSPSARRALARMLALPGGGPVRQNHRFRDEQPHHLAPIAQLDRALPSEGRGQRFESSWVRHQSPVRIRSTSCFTVGVKLFE
jgi:hypothetical protein